MKKFLLVLMTALFLLSEVIAGTINPVVYRSMSSRSYRNHYNNQVNNNTIPYWQAQSNFTTRNRIYSDYANYSNSMYKHNSSVKYNRSSR